MARPPTAQGISGLLRRAGYQRHASTMTAALPGYRVTGDSPGRVRVDYLGLNWADTLDDYAAAIREAGWGVERAADNWLIVTAKGNGND
jgi:hypothetical protein